MKISILGLGPSLALFIKDDYDICIGVNDIWRSVETDIVVCLNPRKDFTPDRLKYIDGCKPQVFYSQIVAWDTRPDFRKINILPGYPDVFCKLDDPAFQKSYCSPFVAAQIGWKYYDASEIHLFGVDMINHPHLDQQLCGKIKMHFRHLKTALLGKNCIFVVHGDGILKDL